MPDALLLTRAISVRAPAELTWRWLCQVAVAPYSYDWIDNRGRRSPRHAHPGRRPAELGQTMAMVFRLTAFDDGHQWTAITTPRGQRLFGPVAMTYAAEPDGPDSRIVCRLAVGAAWPARPGPRARAGLGRPRDDARQFLNLKALAERDSDTLSLRLLAMPVPVQQPLGDQRRLRSCKSLPLEDGQVRGLGAQVDARTSATCSSGIRSSTACPCTRWPRGRLGLQLDLAGPLEPRRVRVTGPLAVQK